MIDASIVVLVLVLVILVVVALGWLTLVGKDK
jgi:hypothetical protein